MIYLWNFLNFLLVVHSFYLIQMHFLDSLFIFLIYLLNINLKLFLIKSFWMWFFSIFWRNHGLKLHSLSFFNLSIDKFLFLLNNAVNSLMNGYIILFSQYIKSFLVFDLKFFIMFFLLIYSILLNQWFFSMTYMSRNLMPSDILYMMPFLRVLSIDFELIIIIILLFSLDHPWRSIAFRQ